MNTLNILAAACVAALLLFAGPLLDEAADAEITATSVDDAQAAAQAGESMARWARRVCNSDMATTLQVEGSEVVCRDVSGQRVGAIVVATRARP